MYKFVYDWDDFMIFDIRLADPLIEAADPTLRNTALGYFDYLGITMFSLSKLY